MLDSHSEVLLVFVGHAGSAGWEKMYIGLVSGSSVRADTFSEGGSSPVLSFSLKELGC